MVRADAALIAALAAVIVSLLLVGIVSHTAFLAALALQVEAAWLSVQPCSRTRDGNVVRVGLSWPATR